MTEGKVELVHLVLRGLFNAKISPLREWSGQIANIIEPVINHPATIRAASELTSYVRGTHAYHFKKGISLKNQASITKAIVKAWNDTQFQKYLIPVLNSMLDALRAQGTANPNVKAAHAAVVKLIIEISERHRDVPGFPTSPWSGQKSSVRLPRLHLPWRDEPVQPESKSIPPPAPSAPKKTNSQGPPAPPSAPKLTQAEVNKHQEEADEFMKEVFKKQHQKQNLMKAWEQAEKDTKAALGYKSFSSSSSSSSVSGSSSSSSASIQPAVSLSEPVRGRRRKNPASQRIEEQVLLNPRTESVQKKKKGKAKGQKSMRDKRKEPDEERVEEKVLLNPRTESVHTYNYPALNPDVDVDRKNPDETPPAVPGTVATSAKKPKPGDEKKTNPTGSDPVNLPDPPVSNPAPIDPAVPDDNKTDGFQYVKIKRPGKNRRENTPYGKTTPAGPSYSKAEDIAQAIYNSLQDQNKKKAATGQVKDVKKQDKQQPQEAKDAKMAQIPILGSHPQHHPNQKAADVKNPDSGLENKIEGIVDAYGDPVADPTFFQPHSDSNPPGSDLKQRNPVPGVQPGTNPYIAARAAEEKKPLPDVKQKEEKFKDVPAGTPGMEIDSIGSGQIGGTDMKDELFTNAQLLITALREQTDLELSADFGAQREELIAINGYLSRRETKMALVGMRSLTPAIRTSLLMMLGTAPSNQQLFNGFSTLIGQIPHRIVGDPRQGSGIPESQLPTDVLVEALAEAPPPRVEAPLSTSRYNEFFATLSPTAALPPQVAQHVDEARRLINYNQIFRVRAGDRPDVSSNMWMTVGAATALGWAALAGKSAALITPMGAAAFLVGALSYKAYEVWQNSQKDVGPARRHYGNINPTANLNFGGPGTSKKFDDASGLNPAQGSGGPSTGAPPPVPSIPAGPSLQTDLKASIAPSAIPPPPPPNINLRQAVAPWAKTLGLVSAGEVVKKGTKDIYNSVFTRRREEKKEEKQDDDDDFHDLNNDDGGDIDMTTDLTGTIAASRSGPQQQVPGAQPQQQPQQPPSTVPPPTTPAPERKSNRFSWMPVGDTIVEDKVAFLDEKGNPFSLQAVHGELDDNGEQKFRVTRQTNPDWLRRNRRLGDDGRWYVRYNTPTGQHLWYPAFQRNVDDVIRASQVNGLRNSGMTWNIDDINRFGTNEIKLDQTDIDNIRRQSSYSRGELGDDKSVPSSSGGGAQSGAGGVPSGGSTDSKQMQEQKVREAKRAGLGLPPPEAKQPNPDEFQPSQISKPGQKPVPSGEPVPSSIQDIVKSLITPRTAQDWKVNQATVQQGQYLRPEFIQGGADFVGEVTKDVALNIVQELGWAEFNNYQWENNEQSDNPFYLGLLVEKQQRFSGLLFGEEFVKEQNEAAKYAIRHLDPKVNAIRSVPQSIQNYCQDTFMSVVPYEGQAAQSDTIHSQMKPSFITKEEFHDVFLSDGFNWSSKGPLEKFTEADATQYPDSQRLLGLEFSDHYAQGLSNINNWIATTVT